MAKKLSHEELIALGKKVDDAFHNNDTLDEYHKLTNEIPETVEAHWQYTMLAMEKYRQEIKETVEAIEGLKETLQNTTVK